MSVAPTIDKKEGAVVEDALHAFSPEAMQLVRSIMFALPDFNAELLEQPRE
ncbi:hypothetical protein PPTG_25000, partial [Phytophthora nicotianae INRA-310]